MLGLVNLWPAHGYAEKEEGRSADYLHEVGDPLASFSQRHKKNESSLSART